MATSGSQKFALKSGDNTPYTFTWSRTTNYSDRTSTIRYTIKANLGETQLITAPTSGALEWDGSSTLPKITCSETGQSWTLTPKYYDNVSLTSDVVVFEGTITVAHQSIAPRTLKLSGDFVFWTYDFYAPFAQEDVDYNFVVDEITTTKKLVLVGGERQLIFNYEHDYSINALSNCTTIRWYLSFKDASGRGVGIYATDSQKIVTSFNNVSLTVGTQTYFYGASMSPINCVPNESVLLFDEIITQINHTSNSSGQSVPVTVNFSTFGPFLNANGYQANIGSPLSGTFTLPVIDRVPNFYPVKQKYNDEEAWTINYTNPLGLNTTTLQLAASISNGAAYEVAFKDISKTGSTASVSKTEDELATIYSKTLDKRIATAIPLKFYLKYKIPAGLSSPAEEKIIASNELSFDFINYEPYFDNPTLVDINPDTVALTGDNTKFIRYASTVQFNLNPVVRKGASIDLIYIDNEDNPISSSSGVFDIVRGDEQETKFIAQVIDSRGYFDTWEKTKSISNGKYVPYVPITCAARAGLLTANGTLKVTVTGKYYKGSFGAQTNTLTIKYRTTDNGSWTTQTTNANPTVDANNNYTYEFTISGLDYNSRYNLTVCAADLINCDGSISTLIVGAVPVFDWSKQDFAFYVPVTINNVPVPTIVESQEGDAYSWSYRKWSDGTAECWRTISVNTAVSNTSNAGWYSSGQLNATNLTYPFTFVERPTVIATVNPTGQTWAILFPSNTAGSTTRTGTYQLNSMSSFSAKDYLISYNIKGRWK